MSRFDNLSVASDGTLWGVAWVDEKVGTVPVQYVPSNDAWVVRSAGIAEGEFMGMVSVGDRNNIWGNSYYSMEDPAKSGRSYRWNPASLAWERVRNPEGDAVILQATAVGADGTVLVNARNYTAPGDLFKYVGGTDVWERFPGGAWGIAGGLSVGSAKNIWAINSPDFDDRHLIRWTPETQWADIAGPSDPQGADYSVSAAADTTTWFSTNWGAVWSYDYGSHGWKQVGSRADNSIYQVTVQNADTAYGLDFDGQPWRWSSATRKWTRMVTPGAAPAAEAAKVYVAKVVSDEARRALAEV